MLNFRNTNILLAIALLLLAAFGFWQKLSPLVWLGVVFVYLTILFYGSYFVNSNFYTPVICRAITGEKEIAISFDDGPTDEITAEILDILEEFNTPAAFFCIGKNITGREAIVRRMHEAGHLIGNHSFSHSALFDLYSRHRMLADLRQMDQVLFDLLGIRPRLFRPPYGVTNPPLHKAIVQGAYIAIGWSVRSLDTVIREEEKLLKKVTRSLAPGDILLFHDTSRTTLHILPSLIRDLKAKGFRITRLDKMLKLDAYV